MYKLTDKRGYMLFNSFRELTAYVTLWEIKDFKIVRIKGAQNETV